MDDSTGLLSILSAAEAARSSTCTMLDLCVAGTVGVKEAGMLFAGAGGIGRVEKVPKKALEQPASMDGHARDCPVCTGCLLHFFTRHMFCISIRECVGSLCICVHLSSRRLNDYAQ